MLFTYYSLVVTAEQPMYQRQWVRSIRSLRQFNQNIPVHLFVFNTPPDSLREEADRQEVVLQVLGDYRDCIREMAGPAGEVLGSMPTLHKLQPLGYIPSDTSQVLYLDCDTFIFADVASLFGKYRTHDWYAREEPSSRKSVLFPYNPKHIDEDALQRIAAECGSVAIPPYNCGVFMLNRGLWKALFSLRQDFFSLAWRLAGGASLWPEVSLPSDLRREVSDWLTISGNRHLEYPSRNFWILDQIAFWLTLGQIPNLSHSTFAAADVLQNGEFMLFPNYKSKCTLAHYFSSNETRFFRACSVGQDQPKDRD